MGYVAYGSGSVTLKDEVDMETVLNILNKEDNFGNSDESGMEGVIEVRYDGNWHEEEVREVLTEIIPYITEGCIDYEGDENCYWRYQFDAKLQQWNELFGTITYDNPKPFTKSTGSVLTDTRSVK